MSSPEQRLNFSTSSCVGGTRFARRCSHLGVPAPYGHNIAPMRVYQRRGRLIGESQERVAKTKSLPGDVRDEVDQLVDFASMGWKSPLDCRLRSRMATRPFRFTGMEERHTPKSELLRFGKLDGLIRISLLTLGSREDRSRSKLPIWSLHHRSINRELSCPAENYQEGFSHVG